MTVKELIDKLKEFPEDSDVIVYGDFYENGYLSIDNNIVLES